MLYYHTNMVIAPDGEEMLIHLNDFYSAHY